MYGLALGLRGYEKVSLMIKTRLFTSYLTEINETGSPFKTVQFDFVDALHLSYDHIYTIPTSLLKRPSILVYGVAAFLPTPTVE